MPFNIKLMPNTTAKKNWWGKPGRSYNFCPGDGKGNMPLGNTPPAKDMPSILNTLRCPLS